MKIEFVVRETADGKSGDEVEFGKVAALVGLRPEDYGKAFNFQGRLYHVVGIKPARRQSVTCERDDDRMFKFTPDAVKRGLLGQ